ncbi:MAG TPA: hypothetical protein VFD13_01280 [Candidatus Kapabacteria bacterium]|nr:hypothetical protein [Candidatus Kapabacteria bacterium]
MSQPKFLICAVGGYNLVTYTTDAFPTLNSEPQFYLVQNGSGKGSFFGVRGELSLGGNLQDFLLAEVSYDMVSADFTNLTIRAAGNDTGFYLSGSLSYFLINVGLKHNFWSGPTPNGLGLQLCGSFGLIGNDDFGHTELVYTSPSSNVLSHKVGPDPIPIASAAELIRIALRAEITYDIPLLSDWLLTPSIGYDAPLTKVDPSLNWRAGGLYFGLAVEYMFRS